MPQTSGANESPSRALETEPSGRAPLFFAAFFWSSLSFASACSSDSASTESLENDDSGANEADDAPLGVLVPLKELKALEASEDPFASHRPAEFECGPLSGWYLEDGRLEVNTGTCDYASLSEPAALDARAGDRLLTTISHFDLTAPEPSEAHLGIAAGEDILWEATIAIPSPANVLELSIELKSAIDAGETITFHLHNHGQNTWNFSQIRVLPTRP